MSIEFQIPNCHEMPELHLAQNLKHAPDVVQAFHDTNLRIQVREHLSEMQSERIWLETLCELEEHRKASRLQLELEQRRQKAFMDRNRHGNEEGFGIDKLVLVFQTRMGSMPGKLRFWWTGPFWVTREFNGSYQLGILAGEILSKWVNRFGLKPYKGRMPENPFKTLGSTEEMKTSGTRRS